jgi:hypothetical protein
MAKRAVQLQEQMADSVPSPMPSGGTGDQGAMRPGLDFSKPSLCANRPFVI